MPTPPTLYFVAGKIAAGKSTLARKLAETHSAILLDADRFLSTLWPDEIHTLEDFKARWPRLCEAVGPVAVDILRSGVSVVLDFPGNTLGQRRWMKGLADAAECAHELHVLDVPDAVCLDRLAARNATGAHAYAPTPEQFAQFTALFVPPSDTEGLVIVPHR